MRLFIYLIGNQLNMVIFTIMNNLFFFYFLNAQQVCKDINVKIAGLILQLINAQTSTPNQQEKKLCNYILKV